jgi:hypothetical protein
VIVPRLLAVVTIPSKFWITNRYVFYVVSALIFAGLLYLVLRRRKPADDRSDSEL